VTVEQLSAGATVLATAIAAAIWLGHLQGRVNGIEKEVTGVKDDITYIRDRIDRALNGRY
jgi:hypothetical protein